MSELVKREECTFKIVARKYCFVWFQQNIKLKIRMTKKSNLSERYKRGFCGELMATGMNSASEIECRHGYSINLL